MARGVVIKGLKELSRQFDRVIKEVDSGSKKAMRKLVRQVAADAKAAAPRDTGEYRKSIKYTMAKNGLFGWAYAGKKGDTKRGYLGHLLEYGTVKNRAIPHFLPALAKAKKDFESEIKAVIAAVKGGPV
ncbi:MAG TPA: HK97 gp10 family phage protein [Candidatus Rifleibacterium sp.]|nr:HK97 gp10 family phage protein [Candidatus Rifleibacterium sp.]